MKHRSEKNNFLFITKHTVFLFLLSIFLSSFVMMNNSEPQKKKKKAEEPVEIIIKNMDANGTQLEIEFLRGEQHNHPMMAIWIEDLDGNYIQTLFVNESVATGVFSYGDASSGKWEPGFIRRPAAVPYWSHQRDVVAYDGLYIPTPDDPIPDAYSGATPKANFLLQTTTDNVQSSQFRVLFEINQSWDWNNYWTNDKFPDDPEYKTSSQPALVYEVTVDPNSALTEYTLEPIGHSHYSGKDGSLNADIGTLTTALDITERIVVRVVRN